MRHALCLLLLMAARPAVAGTNPVTFYPEDEANALALILSEPNTPVQLPETRVKQVMAAIRHLAIKNEFLDRREFVYVNGGEYVFSEEYDFENYVNFFRQKRVDMEGCPPLHSSDMLISSDIAWKLFSLNSGLKSRIDETAKWEKDREDILFVASEDCRRLANIWSNVALATDPNTFVEPRRLAMKSLADTLGGGRWEAIVLPPGTVWTR